MVHRSWRSLRWEGVPQRPSVSSTTSSPFDCALTTETDATVSTLNSGGSESITLVAGEDASEDFMAIHSIVSSSAFTYLSNLTDRSLHRTPNFVSPISTLEPSSRRILLSKRVNPSLLHPILPSCPRPNGKLLNSYLSSESSVPSAQFTAILIVSLLSETSITIPDFIDSHSNIQINLSACPRGSTSTLVSVGKDLPIQTKRASSSNEPTRQFRFRTRKGSSTCSSKFTSALLISRMAGR